ncbi:competence protein ComEA [Caloramator fervidus]|uniref:Competence protein ComEA n=1 Tax=Caloramator fervidus TaxID=29344 RepID=A0A1H5WMF4_9CLOT|nr:helix-hairpin-helix domain-containing protein [Caloramator fervidus]SEG00485.1 competence protein ComEA [Caloramator fervidus]
MDLTKREKIGLILFLSILVFINAFYYYRDKKSSEITVIKSSIEQKDSEIKVYICGEVKKPGVYTLREGDRLYKLLEMCGGFTDNALKEKLNLAMKLKDEDYIYVPSKADIQVDQSLNDSSQTKININTAGLEELKSLPRIGDALAQRIIEYRQKNGPFRRIEDIKNVSGIGDKMFENIKDKITVR